MIPLSDIEPNRYIRLPVSTLLLITLNALVALMVFSMGGDRLGFISFLRQFGAVPEMILGRQGGGGLSLITSLFLHGGLLHLFGNMLALWVYGRRVEDACGHVRFLAFYLTCGIGAGMAQVLAQASADTPVIGASGAVFGIMGAYLILYPEGRIRTLVMFGIVPIFPKIRALWLILYFLALEIPPALDMLFSNTEYRIGHWVHLGGFLSSLSVLFFLRPEVLRGYRSQLPQ